VRYVLVVAVVAWGLVACLSSGCSLALSEVMLLTPASNKYQNLPGFLAALLWPFVEVHQTGAVIIAPSQMKIAPDLPGRERTLASSS
jgi:hypothetical protein